MSRRLSVIDWEVLQIKESKCEAIWDNYYLQTGRLITLTGYLIICSGAGVIIDISQGEKYKAFPMEFILRLMMRHAPANFFTASGIPH